MTDREQKYINDCQSLLDNIRTLVGDAAAKAVCINALSEHIRKTMAIWMVPILNSPDKMSFLIGLTYADLIQLQNGGTIEVNPKDVGLLDMPITIFLGGTEEYMAKGFAKHPDATAKFLDSHGDNKN